MAFQTFDLGRVLQQGEAIKGMKRQGITDQLQQQYLTQNIKAGETAATNVAADREAKLGKDKATQVFTTMQYALQSPDPSAFVEQNAPELIQELSKNGVNWQQVDQPTRLKMLQGIMAKAGAEIGQGPAIPKKPEPFTLGQGQTRFDESGKPVASVAPRQPANGFSMTMPDGTTVQMGGPAGGVGPADLSGPTKNKLQDSIIQATDELERLNSIGEGFDPKFLQIPGRLKAGALKLKDISGLKDLTPEESQYLDKFSTFKADSAKNLSTILNRLSGAAISPAEGERLKKGIPNDEDSPTQFIAKYRAAVKDSTRAIMRANWALKNGIGVNSVEQLSKTMPLGGIDRVYEERVNAIWQEMGGTEETRAQAKKQANGEFGLAR